MNSSRTSALANENSMLKCKIEALEGLVQTMRREIQSVRSALGPWYRTEELYPQLSRRASSSHEQPPQTQVLPAAVASPSTTYIPFGSSHASTSTTPDALAPYFPPEADENIPWLERRLNTMSLSPTGDTGGCSYRESMAHTSVAPINLSTTLEGSLAGLRDSIVTLSASVDSLARRHDIELRNETLRANEEISRLNYTMHGLRMQVCRFPFASVVSVLVVTSASPGP